MKWIRLRYKGEEKIINIKNYSFDTNGESYDYDDINYMSSHPSRIRIIKNDYLEVGIINLNYINAKEGTINFWKELVDFLSSDKSVLDWTGYGRDVTIHIFE